ncbi:hypothetical protein H072_5826 [Dactylellina haptotyla CBS 200.50]|uniref:Uncharacterized protein n=1 Tax=Dactylellina haptotyla (strain CBS 200.50) TaxID=1284197 RepID=S8AGW0_DACHA|nr:hypothetical protein H072_5826 [Dactylellina haptotyla CBS 200.50]
MFGEIGTKTSGVTNRKEFWRKFLSGMRTNETDAPFALVYSRVESFYGNSNYSDTQGKPSNQSFTIEHEGSYNIPEGHICMPPRINLNEPDEGFAAAFRESCNHEFLYLRDDDLIPPHLLEGLVSPF